MLLKKYIEFPVGELPSHGHSASSDTQGNHSHSFYGINTPTQADNPGVGAALHASATGRTQNNRISTAGAHGHTIYIGNTGSNQAHNNMQPYIAVFMWKRTA